MNKRIPIFVGFLLVMLALWSLLTPTKFIRQLIERLDNLGYDLQLRTRVLAEKETPIENIAIIDIDDKSLQVEGRWPWSRKKMAELVYQLEQQGAVIIAFDILFAEPETNILTEVLNILNNPPLTQQFKKNLHLFDYDAMFAKSLMNNAAILAITFLPKNQIQHRLPAPLLILNNEEEKNLNLFKANGFISNIPLIQQAAKSAGFINIFADQDGIIRRAPFIMQYANKIYPALALQAVVELLGDTPRLITKRYHNELKLEGIQLGSRIIPLDEKGQVLVPFIGKSFTFPYYAATDILHNRLAKDSLLGKIVFIGTSATGLADFHATAIQNHFPGIEIQASLVNGILKNNFYYQPAWAWGVNFFMTICLGLIATFVFPFFGPRRLSIAIILLPLILFFINNWIWIKTKLVLSFLMPILLIILIAFFNLIYGYLFETRKREKLKEMFGQYVPAEHINAMLNTAGNYALQGEDREMSVLFADIRNFTTLSENMSAKNLVNLLNTFFTPMTAIIFKHKGTIDKYVGDLIMAFWGAPLKDKHHAKHALFSALEMQEKVKLLTPYLAQQGWPAISIGIGINSGIMSVGDMGSEFRRNYTVLGDEVNLASRIESLTKFYGVDIIVSENTYKLQKQFIFRKLDKVKVKGKKNSIAIYEVIGKMTSLTKELEKELITYHEALDYYFKQQWDNAYELIKTLHTHYPDKKIYSIYSDRILELKTQSLPPEWNGVYIHHHK